MKDSTSRVLSASERAALEALITRGVTDYVTVTDTDRARWLEQVPSTAAGATCTCGTCPSIELTHSDTTVPAPTLTVVLQAYTDDALLLLFIEHGHLSYLELAPLAPDGSITAFPHRSRSRFDTKCWFAPGRKRLPNQGSEGHFWHGQSDASAGQAGNDRLRHGVKRPTPMRGMVDDPPSHAAIITHTVAPFSRARRGQLVP